VEKGISLIEIQIERVYQCDFDDPIILKFIAYAINEYSTGKSGNRRIVRTTMDLPIPVFEEKKRNKAEIDRKMPNYFSIAHKRSEQQSVDRKIYSLFGISPEEVRLIEENFR
jgi:hypothetical protein